MDCSASVSYMTGCVWTRTDEWRAFRALYVGNLAGARKLLAREDVDAGIKDREGASLHCALDQSDADHSHAGLTAFDVYNSTVEGTNPPPLSASTTSANGRLELFTWGANRNFVLGFPGDGDRAFPERVPLKRLENEGGSGLGAFRPLGVRDIGMARLHTGVLVST